MPTNRERIDEAANLISEVMDTLDLTEGFCDHCQRKNYVQFSQYQAHKELKAIVRKLRAFAANPSLNS